MRIDMIDKEKIKEIYNQYPYHFEKEGEDFLIFSYDEGIYPAVDIVFTKAVPETQQNEIKQDYSQSGFATRLLKVEDLRSLEDSLFKNFFSPEAAKQKLLKEYKDYTTKVMSPYNKGQQIIPEYRYINVAYKLEKNFKEDTSINENVIDKLSHLMLNERGSSLIIVEAPAGFGKTSTSYELVHRLCKEDINFRPFFMKLEKDRQAPTFRYLLLSQIDRNFKVKHKNDVVLQQVKKGRIPLIIDGFDELLSKDLDKGEQRVGFEKVETMLSTIGELLTDNSKIILTSRKTAIFSGEQFIEWYYHQLDSGKNFTLYRFQLEVPSVHDWLPKEKLEQLPESLLKITNPVLLSYLRYASNVNYENLSDSLNLVEAYFTFLFEREQERQDILLKVPEQHQIFEKLAAYFAAFDVTSIPRVEVSEAIYEIELPLIEKYSKDKEKEKNLVNKLTNHAILDRHENGNIGFINDFIYGTLLGQSLKNYLSKEKKYMPFELLSSLSDSTMDKIIEASQLWDKENKIELAQALKNIPELSMGSKFSIDRYLCEKLTQKYEYLSINQETIKNISMAPEGELYKCTFSDCIFIDTELDFNRIKECYFINCDLRGLNVKGNQGENYFYSLKESDVKSISIENVNPENELEIKELDALILSHYFRKGTLQPRPYRLSSLILNLFKEYDRRLVTKRLDWMQSQKYIFTKGDISWILREGTDYYNSIS